VNYLDGEEIKVGDKVKLWEDCYGVVVASIDGNEYDLEYPREEWQYLKSGVLIRTDKAGLIHYLEPENSLELIERGATE